MSVRVSDPQRRCRKGNRPAYNSCARARQPTFEPQARSEEGLRRSVAQANPRKDKLHTWAPAKRAPSSFLGAAEVCRAGLVYPSVVPGLMYGTLYTKPPAARRQTQNSLSLN